MCLRWPSAERATALSLTKRGVAFTLIELLVVIAIIAILAALLLPAVNRTRNATWQAPAKRPGLW